MFELSYRRICTSHNLRAICNIIPIYFYVFFLPSRWSSLFARGSVIVCSHIILWLFVRKRAPKYSVALYRFWLREITTVSNVMLTWLHIISSLIQSISVRIRNQKLNRLKINYIVAWQTCQTPKINHTKIDSRQNSSLHLLHIRFRLPINAGNCRRISMTVAIKMCKPICFQFIIND